MVANPICATESRTARFIGTNSKSQGSLICLASCVTVSEKSNLSWAKYESLKQTDLHFVASISSRIRLFLPSNTGLSGSFRHGVLIVSVLVVHPDSMMMSGSSFKSDSTYKYCLVQSTPTLNPQFNGTRLFKFESLCPSVLHVVCCVFGFEKSIGVFESIIIQQTLGVVALHCHSHILIWITEQWCAVFASSKAS